ncbi:MAG: TonB-dependent receptor [Burkholderiaceae bacterium]|nr:TonB-dependent receptor [Burkholderiaceae bacterium]
MKFMKHHFALRLLRHWRAALYLFTLHGLAQAQSPAGAAAPALKELTVTANPLGTTEPIAPAAAYSGATLLLRSRSTLGETLDGTPGVSSSYFGPNASRPIIRGLDGDRIRVLQNSGASIDASALSFDHALPIDPLTVERIEVLRGPGALLYGGSAVGGVVNVIDNRIPRDAVDGVSGKADFGLASGQRERGGSVLVEGGNERFALHVDAFERRSGDLRVPIRLDCTRADTPGPRSRICNSAAASRGGAVGGTAFFDGGYLGAMVSDYRSNYGTVADDAVTIGMHSRRYALEGEWRRPTAAIAGIKWQLSRTDYRHTEFESGAAGTLFRNRGGDLRVELRHEKWGPLEGLIGLQAESARFSADGAEAFAPFSRTRQTAVFAYEEMALSWGRLSFGARAERVRIESLGNPDPSVTRFAPGSRNFGPRSQAVGLRSPLGGNWQFTSNLAYTQRAPKDYELYANGPHLATAAWESGDATLGLERATSLDLGLAWKAGADRLAVNVYRSRFSNYIGLQGTGATRDADGERNPVDRNGDRVADGSGASILDELRYSGVRARFTGLEASGTLRLSASPASLDLEWRADLVRADNLTTGEPLPRIAPARVGATLIRSQGAWSARVGMDASAAQNHVPQTGQRATAAYTLWHAALTYRVRSGAAQRLWYARLDNITDKLAYSAASVLTTTAFPKAPLPGRSLKLGLQVSF